VVIDDPLVRREQEPASAAGRIGDRLTRLGLEAGDHRPGQCPRGEVLARARLRVLDLVFGDEDQQLLLELRLNELAARMDPGELTEAQRQVRTSARNRVEALVRSAIDDLDRWHTTLHAIANQIEDLDVRAKAAVVDTREEP